MRTVVLAAAVAGLAPVHTGAQDAPPDAARLFRQLADADAREEAARTIRQQGQSAVPVLMRQWDAGADPARDQEVLGILDRLGPDSVAAIPKLLRVLDDAEIDLARDIVRTLGHVAPWDRDAVEAVTAALDDLMESLLIDPEFAGERQAWFKVTVFETRSVLPVNPHEPLDELARRIRQGHLGGPALFSIEVLGHRCGPRGETPTEPVRAAVPFMRGWLQTLTDFSGRPLHRPPLHHAAFVARAMVDIAQDHRMTSLAHAWCLLHGDRWERRDAAIRLGGYHPPAVEAIPALELALRDADPTVVREAVTALGAMGPAAAPAVPALTGLTEHEDEEIARRARAALEGIGEPRPGVADIEIRRR